MVWEIFTNQAMRIHTISRRVLAQGKASKRHCNPCLQQVLITPSEPIHDSLSFNIKRLGATRMA
jgi:hypothetical protein